MSFRKTPLALALIAAGFLSAPLLSQAQPNYAPAASEAAAPQIDEQKVEQFVEAFGEVQQLQQQFSQQLEGVSSQEEAQTLQQQAQQQMIEAVEQAGLTVADYNMVVAAMEQDEALRETILNRVQ
jgi:hypothetical protein